MTCPDCGRPSRVRLDEPGDLCPLAYAHETNFSVIHAEANCLRAQLRAERAAHAETRRERDKIGNAAADLVGHWIACAVEPREGSEPQAVALMRAVQSSRFEVSS